METNSIQQEILLIKNTSLSEKQLSERDGAEKEDKLTPPEQLEAACWNGFLDEMLPGIIDTSKEGKNLFLWDIMEARSFLDIELCEQPQVIDSEYSINPYIFMSSVCYV